jgi:hypothetical protein
MTNANKQAVAILRRALLSGISAVAAGILLQPHSAAAQMSCTTSGNSQTCRNSATGQLTINATAAGNAITQTNATAITTAGQRAAGVVLGNGQFVAYANPAMIFTNTAAISTTGLSSDGINSYGRGNSQTISNAGTITTTDGTGILIHGGSPDVSAYAGGPSTAAVPGGDITVTNTGRISVGGQVTSGSGMGIAASSGGFAIYNGLESFIPGGSVTITNNGAINATSSAIYGESGGGTVTITNNAALTSSGWSAISGRSWGGNVIISNTAALTITGAGSKGIVGDSYDHSQGSVSGNVTITNSGRIDMSGVESTGIDAGSSGGAVTISNSGIINGSGQYATGINGGGASSTVNHSGRIDLTGANSTGIAAFSSGGAASVRSTGDIFMRAWPAPAGRPSAEGSMGRVQRLPQPDRKLRNV